MDDFLKRDNKKTWNTENIDMRSNILNYEPVPRIQKENWKIIFKKADKGRQKIWVVHNNKEYTNILKMIDMKTVSTGFCTAVTDRHNQDNLNMFGDRQHYDPAIPLDV